MLFSCICIPCYAAMLSLLCNTTSRAVPVGCHIGHSGTHCSKKTRINTSQVNICIALFENVLQYYLHITDQHRCVFVLSTQLHCFCAGFGTLSEQFYPHPHGVDWWRQLSAVHNATGRNAWPSLWTSVLLCSDTQRKSRASV